MCAMFRHVKYIFLISCVFCCAFCVKDNSDNKKADILSKLYDLAQQSEHIHSRYPYSYQLSGKYPEYYQNVAIDSYGQYPGSSYLTTNTNNYPYKTPNPIHDANKSIRPQPPNFFSAHRDQPPNFFNNKESLLEVLHLIARNDKLHCVPRLICEVASGTISGRQQGFNLPISINMESLLSFFSVINGAESSPVLHFGKAALLGFSSRGNTGTCNYAYPECPSDPDKVVKYLNNHNGGFFRFFNEGSPTQNNPHNDNTISHWKTPFAEQRIQNNAIDSHFRYPTNIEFTGFADLDNIKSENVLKFPNNDVDYDGNGILWQSHSALKFPRDESYEDSFRKPKESFYENAEYSLNLQKPLPNHKVTSMIFPVRTGTGDLRLDPEELQDYRRPSLYEDDKVRIVFNEINTNGGHSNAQYAKGFSFPGE